MARKAARVLQVETKPFSDFVSQQNMSWLMIDCARREFAISIPYGVSEDKHSLSIVLYVRTNKSELRADISSGHQNVASRQPLLI